MKKLNIEIGRSKLIKNVYKVSKSSDAYSFFINEYKNLPEDGVGNILVPINDSRIDTTSRKPQKRTHNSLSISRNSPLYDFFNTEYGLIDRTDEGIIVPEEEISIRTK